MLVAGGRCGRGPALWRAIGDGCSLALTQGCPPWRVSGPALHPSTPALGLSPESDKQPGLEAAVTARRGNMLSMARVLTPRGGWLPGGGDSRRSPGGSLSCGDGGALPATVRSVLCLQPPLDPAMLPPLHPNTCTTGAFCLGGPGACDSKPPRPVRVRCRF